jgi:DNA-binding response OmpR family regulator
MKLLLVEDELALQQSIQTHLLGEGFACEAVGTFREAEEKICTYRYDCLLLDINLPDGNGLDLIGVSKKVNSAAGIIIISARESVDDRVKGLKDGADDYLVKPFHLSELNARVYSLLRRIRFSGEEQVEAGDLTVSPEDRTVRVKGKTLDLTKKEFDLLLYFLSNRNRVLSKEAICEYLWGDYADNAGSLDFVYTHIKNLRRKIAAAGGGNLIESVYGVGYKFAEP